MQTTNKSTSISLRFEKAQLPPFSDILLLGRKSPVGLNGISKSLEYLVPNNFEVVPIDDQIVEAMVVNKSILRRVPVDKLIAVLADAVFPFMSEVEIMKVDIKVQMSFEVRLDEDSVDV